MHTLLSNLLTRLLAKLFTCQPIFRSQELKVTNQLKTITLSIYQLVYSSTFVCEVSEKKEKYDKRW